MACEGGDEHEETAFGEMEIGNESVDEPEAIWWSDKKTSVTSGWDQFTIIIDR